MSAVALALGWLINGSDASTLAHYKSLSHDALLSELASKYDSHLATNIMGALFLVLVLVLAVDLLTSLFERVWARLGGSRSAPTGT
jgi:cytochrome b